MVWTDFPHASTPLDLVKAPQQIIATLRRLEQVQGLGQNTERVSCKKLSAASLYGGNIQCWILVCADHYSVAFVAFYFSLCNMHIYLL